MNTPNPRAPDLIPPQEAARRLGISRNTLLRWEERGHITPVRTVTGMRRYKADDIDALLKESA